jgi:hypothetical protein
MTTTAAPAVTITLRRLGRNTYLCPSTGHWAGWHDASAVQHHGVDLGKISMAEARRDEFMPRMAQDLVLARRLVSARRRSEIAERDYDRGFGSYAECALALKECDAAVKALPPAPESVRWDCARV